MIGVTAQDRDEWMYALQTVCQPGTYPVNPAQQTWTQQDVHPPKNLLQKEHFSPEIKQNSAPASVEAEQLQEIIKEIQAAAFFKGAREDIIRSISKKYLFRCEDVLAIFSNLNFSDERIAAAGLLVPKIIDPENSKLLLERLPFDHEKHQVQQFFRK